MGVADGWLTQKRSAQGGNLVLVDCQIPVLDGYEATRKIRQLADEVSRSVLIIGVTAHAMAGDRDLCLDAALTSA